MCLSRGLDFDAVMSETAKMSGSSCSLLLTFGQDQESLRDSNGSVWLALSPCFVAGSPRLPFRPHVVPRFLRLCALWALLFSVDGFSASPAAAPPKGPCAIALALVRLLLPTCVVSAQCLLCFCSCCSDGAISVCAVYMSPSCAPLVRVCAARVVTGLVAATAGFFLRGLAFLPLLWRLLDLLADGGVRRSHGFAFAAGPNSPACNSVQRLRCPTRAR